MFITIHKGETTSVMFWLNISGNIHRCESSNSITNLFCNQFIPSFFTQPTIIFQLFCLEFHLCLVQLSLLKLKFFKLFIRIGKLTLISIQHLLKWLKFLTICTFSKIISCQLIDNRRYVRPSTNNIFLWTYSIN